MTIKPTRVHAFNHADALGHHDAVALAGQLQRGETSATALVQAAYQRLELVNPELHAIACLQEEAALAQARFYDDVGNFRAFQGIPGFLKDNLDLQGLPTRHGSAAMPDTARKHTSAVAQQIIDTGVVLLGKTKLPEFGLTATTEYSKAEPAHNPWNIGHSTGGSSGGSAALVAAGVVPIAHANDGGGSIRIPAACCGLVGLKPSRGRLAMNEMAKSLPINIVSDGIVSRSVRDTAAFFALAEEHYKNPTLPPLGHITTPGRKRLKIGMFTQKISGDETDTACVEAVHKAAALCEELGHEVQEIKVPISAQFADDFLLYWGMLAASISHLGKLAVDRYMDTGKLEPLTHGLAKHFTRNLLKFPFALRRLYQFEAQYATAFADLDVLLSPTLGQPAPPLGYLALDLPFEQARERLVNFASFTAAQNVAGAPAISLPMHHTAEGIPVGVHFAAAMGHEFRLIELALEIEQAQPFKMLA
ncbi:MAG: amidase [Limnobacter sp.]|uniref:amidase n=1 Tax=Limnobacter sp. TaxID=2003368 RepID=UPI001202AE40|nr:amidase [Limnobacter sp.]RZO92620.1 MAG: amidase [Limnobacter sp.]